jgi:Na+/H+ antiporter NhaA
VLLVAAAAALVWANVDAASYERLWTTELAFRLGGAELALDLRHWVNDGLMALFFVLGLEARREFDTGELRERSRVAVPLLAGLGGMLVPALVYLAFNAESDGARGWAIAMSTDTAFVLGTLALLGRRLPNRLHSFVLTVVVADDLVVIGVVAVAYTDEVELVALAVALALFALVLAASRLRVRTGGVYLALGVALWGALQHAGVDSVAAGLAMGLVTYAWPASRGDLDRAAALFRRFREQPTPELARTARAGVAAAISPNERYQALFHGWTSYLVVPLFALANTGVPLERELLARAATSSVAIGAVLGFLVGKPVGIVGCSWLVARLSGGRRRPPVGWGSVLGAGVAAGIGFTIAMLVADRAFAGETLEEAKLGILVSALAAALLSFGVLRVVCLLPQPLRARLLLGGSEAIVDLADPVDPETDHVRGPRGAAVTLVEYGDYECSYCGRAEAVVRELLAGDGDLRYVWRHLPLPHVHPHAALAAEAAEAAAAQGRFWDYHDLLLAGQDALDVEDLVGRAERLGLDVERFVRDLREHHHAPAVAEDVESADLSGVSGTPTFFLNGRRYRGPHDVASLSRAVAEARAAAVLARR